MANLLQMNSWMYQWSKKISAKKKKKFFQREKYKIKRKANKKLKIRIEKYVRSTIK